MLLGLFVDNELGIFIGLLTVDLFHLDIGDVLLQCFLISDLRFFGHLSLHLLKLLLAEKFFFFAFLLRSFAGRFASRCSF